MSYDRALRTQTRPHLDEDTAIGSRSFGAVKEMRLAQWQKQRTGRLTRSATGSVTVRLSKAECARLHQRAAEAGADGFGVHAFLHI